MKPSETLILFLGALALLWMMIPALLGFSVGQTARWGRVTEIPAVLDEWWMEQSGGGRITIMHDDGSKTVISTNRNGETASVKTFSADGTYLFDYDTAKRDLNDWKKFETGLKEGEGG